MINLNLCCDHSSELIRKTILSPYRELLIVLSVIRILFQYSMFCLVQINKCTRGISLYTGSVYVSICRLSTLCFVIVFDASVVFLIILNEFMCRNLLSQTVCSCSGY